MRTVSLQRITSGQSYEGADLLFEPALEGCTLLEWQSLDRTVEAGYRSAVTAIERWQEQQSRETSRER